MADYTLGVEITGDASGLQSEAKQAEKAVEDVAKSSESAAQRVASSFSGAFQSFGGGIKNGLATAGQGLTNLGGKFESAGAQMTNSGKAMSVGLTAPLTAIYKASDAAFKEVDAGMDIVVTKTGATGEALEGLQQSMENVATSIPTDFATAGEAVGEVNTRFGLTGEALEDLSSKFVKFSSLNETNVSSSVDKTQQILSAFGLTAEDAGDLLDTFNAVGQATGVNLDALMSSMVQNSAAFKEMGFSAADTANFLGEVEMSGVDSSQVMAGLKKSLQNAAKEGKPMSEALSEVQSSIKDAATDTEATQVAMELFGAKAGPAIAQAVREGKLSFDQLGTSLTDAAGNIDTTFENTLDGVDKMTPSMNRLKTASADLSDQVNEALAPVMEKLAGAVEKVSEWFDGLDPNTQRVIVVIGILVAALGPLLLIFGSISTAIGGLIGANGLGGLLTALSTLSAPVLAIIAVVGVLVGVFITLWNTNEEFRTKVTEIWTELQTIFGEFVEGLKAKFSEWGLSMDVIKGAWEAFCNFLAPILTAVLELIKNAIGFALDFILGLLSVFHGLFTGNWGEVWDGVKQIFDAAVTFLKDTFGGLATKLIEKAKELGEKIKEKFEEIKEGVKQKIFDMVSSAVAEFAYFYWTTKEKFEEIKETIKEKIEAAKEKAIEIFTNIVESIKEKVGDIRDRIEEGFNDAVDFITSLPGQAYNWGADIINSIADGIWGAIGSITDAVSGIADTIWSYLHFSEPDVGPLSDFHTWVPDMMHGLADSMKKNMPVLEAGVSMVADRMTGVIPGTGTAGRYGGGESSGVHNTWGGVNITVNAAEGQNEESIADEVMRRMMDLVVLEG